MSWFLAILGFAVLVVLHELGHFTAAKAVGMRVEKFSLFFGPMVAKFTRGETTYGIGTIPLGGYVKITGMSPYEELDPDVAHRAYLRQPVWKRIVVISAGPAVNIVLAFLVLWIIYWATTLSEPTSNVERVETGSPAAGLLQPGDRLVAVDGERGSREDLVARIGTHQCADALVAGCRASDPAMVTVERDGSTREFEIAPVYDAEYRRMRLGFSFGVVERDLGAGGAAGESVSTMWEIATTTVSTLAQIFKAEKRKEIGGVVGATERTKSAFDVSLVQAFFLIGVISLSLGLINLFPFLPLDGGHIFWALAEKIRGRAIPFRIMERAGIVGFALVIVLFFVGLSNDINRLTGDDFGVR